MKQVYFILMAAFFSFYSLSAQTVHVTVPGTLDDAIAGLGTIHNLTVTGTIDSTDFMTLGDIFTLESLDLSGTTITNNRVPRETFLFHFFITSVILPPTATVIGNNGFCGCSNLEQLELPASLKVIETSAFSLCSKLTQLNFPASLEKIGIAAFESCSLSAQIHIPSNVSYIGSNAFGGNNVSAYTVDASNLYFTAENDILFNNNKTILYSYPVQRINVDYTIPSTVETIDYGAFDGVKHLGSISIPASVKKIYVTPFSKCPELTSIQVDAGNMNYASLNGVLYNKGITILIRSPQQKSGIYELPATVTYISDNAFYDNRIIDEIILPQNLDSIGRCAFTNCMNLNSLKLPDNLKEINLGAFSSCKQFDRIIVPLEVDSIPEDVFNRCESLNTLILQSKVKYFRYTNLNLCSNIDSIWINAVIPPVVPAPFYFDVIDTINSTLFVPKGSLASYKSHNFWKHFPTEEIDYTLELSANSLVSEIGGLECDFSIISNTEWMLSANQNWIHISKAKGLFKEKIGVTIDANTGAPRQGIITISGLGVEAKTIEITQEGVTSVADPSTLDKTDVGLDPTRSFLYVKNAEGNKLALYNLSGECILMKDIKASYEEIDIQYLPSGFYLVKVGEYAIKVSK